MACARSIFSCAMKALRIAAFLISAAVTLSVAPSSAASPAASARVPSLVAFEDILAGAPGKASDVRWFDNAHLIASVSSSGNSEAQAQLIGLDGTFSNVQVEGRLISPSPDGGAALSRVEDGWVLTTLDAGARMLIPDPANEGRAFRSYRRPVWSPDGRYAAFGERYRLRGSGVRKAKVEMGASVIELGETPAASSGSITRLTVIDRERPQEPRRLYLDDVALNLQWSSQNVLYIARVAFSADDPYTAILALTKREESPREIYRTDGRFQSMIPAIHPNGEMIAVSLNVETRNWDEFQSFVLVDPATGQETRRLTRNLPILGDDYVWSRDGQELYARVRGGGLDQIWAIPLHGEPRQLTGGPRNHFEMDLSPDGLRLSYQTEDGYGRKDIRVLDLASGEEQIVYVIADPSAEYDLGAWRHIRWKSTDGVRPYGYLFLPPDFDDSRRYPMIVHVHGGGGGSRLSLRAPFSALTSPGPLEWHAWAALGYVVFAPDYRSTGDYGGAVIAKQQARHAFDGIPDMEDLVSGVRHMIDEGYVDPDRIALIGDSAGGRRVFQTLTRHSELFAAAILNEPTTPDPMSTVIRLSSGRYAGNMPAGVLDDLLNASFGEEPELFKTNYLFDAIDIKTPTLIMMGDEKAGGVLQWPYEVVYSILKSEGTPARMIAFPGQGHGYSDPAVAKLAFEETRRWLETHMPPEPGDPDYDPYTEQRP